MPCNIIFHSVHIRPTCDLVHLPVKNIGGDGCRGRVPILLTNNDELDTIMLETFPTFSDFSATPELVKSHMCNSWAANVWIVC